MNLKLAVITLENNIKEEFQYAHISLNLVNTMYMEVLQTKTRLVIPAPIYNLKKFKEDKIIINSGLGSYASYTDKENAEFTTKENKRYAEKTGCKLSTKHVGFLDRCVLKTIETMCEGKNYIVYEETSYD